MQRIKQEAFIVLLHFSIGLQFIYVTVPEARRAGPDFLSDDVSSAELNQANENHIISNPFESSK